MLQAEATREFTLINQVGKLDKAAIINWFMYFDSLIFEGQELEFRPFTG